MMGKEKKLSTINANSAATSSSETCNLLLDGEWVKGAAETVTVLDKYSQEPIAVAPSASDDQIAVMIDAAHAAFKQGAPDNYERGAILERAAVLIEENRDDLAKTIQAEAGFTRSDANGEISRCLQTLRLSAEEARRLSGDVVPIAGAPGQSHRIAFTLRVPLGVVLAVTPFNSPLNTVMHKVAPALAAGNAVIVKPSSNTPITTCKMAKILMQAGLPKGLLSVLHGGARVVGKAMEDQRVRFIAFTGSTEVGRAIQSKADLRRTQMELGSIAFTIINDDADLDVALPKVVSAGFRKAGQVCTSVQMLLVQRAVYDEVVAKMTDLVKAVPFGDPGKETTVTGPLITVDAAKRVEEWVKEALDKGARQLVGGPREGAVVPPTLLVDVSPDMRVGCQEVFGPVVSIIPFDTMDEAFDRVNSTPYGLASGIFTNRMSDAFAAVRSLDVGGVHVNETSSSRVDLMPYGGSKDSGFGREGPHYAIHELTEERVVSITA